MFYQSRDGDSDIMEQTPLSWEKLMKEKKISYIQSRKIHLRKKPLHVACVIFMTKSWQEQGQTNVKDPWLIRHMYENDIHDRL
jgi:hypothetical protein